MYTVLESTTGDDVIVASPRGFIRIPQGGLVIDAFAKEVEVIGRLNGFYKAVGSVEPVRVWPGFHGRDWAASIRGLEAFGIRNTAACDDPQHVGRYETTLPEGVEVVAHEIADVTLGAEVIHKIAYQVYGILPD